MMRAKRLKHISRHNKFPLYIAASAKSIAARRISERIMLYECMTHDLWSQSRDVLETRRLRLKLFAVRSADSKGLCILVGFWFKMSIFFYKFF
jgi:hypothetical protein